MVTSLSRSCTQGAQRSTQHLPPLHRGDEVSSPAQGGARGEVPALPRWRTEQGRRHGTTQLLWFFRGLLSPGRQQNSKDGSKLCIFYPGGKQGFFLRTLDTAQRLPHLPCRAARPGSGHCLALGASVPGRSFPPLPAPPFSEPGGGRQPCVPGNVLWQAWARSAVERPSDL